MKKLFITIGSVSLFTGLIVACSTASRYGQNRSPQNETDSYMTLNPLAGSTVLYETQVRSANACDPTVGSLCARTFQSLWTTRLSPNGFEYSSAPS